MDERVYLIWSNEHRRWWGPGENGYVMGVADAGCYTRSRAVQIVKQAQLGRKRGEVPPEIAVPYSDAVECLQW